MIKFDIFDHTHLYSTNLGPQTHCANMKIHLQIIGKSDFRQKFVILLCLALVVKNIHSRESYD